jgi:queuine/archaeosine tRNA-ribosyltransferase
MLMDGAKKYQGKKNVILLDSGVFESYWFQDGKWNFAKYASVVKKVSPAFFISFDGGVHTHGKRGEDGFVLRDVDRSISLSPKAICLVAVHGTTPERLVKNVQTLLDKRPHVVAIAVAERDCGETIIQRSHTIALVRNALGERFLHILGCGHPQSMAAYVYVGADSFDSLDWCRHGIRRSTNDLVDLSHVSIQGCSCNVCGQGVARTEAALLHNLLYYQDFSAQLQRMTKEGTLRDFIMAHLGKTAIETIDGRIPK